MKKTFIFFALIFIISCTRPAKETVTSDNPSFQVELLFEVDGCKVYRFTDNGGYKYFSNCNGAVTWNERHGKTTHTVSLSTNAK